MSVEIGPGPTTISRLAVRAVHCAECGAEPGEPCRGRRRARKSNHLTRVEYAIARRELKQAESERL